MLFLTCKQSFNWFKRVLFEIFIKSLQNQFYAEKLTFRPLLIQTSKILKSFRNFLVKSTSECYFWLANKVSTDSNEYFLKFSLKVFRISFKLKKSLLGHFWFKLFNIEKFSKFSGQKLIRMLFLTCKQSFNWF